MKRFLLPENLRSKTRQPRNLAKQPLIPQSPVPTGRFLHHSVNVAQGTKVRGLWTCPRMNSNGTEGATQIRLQVSPALRSCVCVTRFPAADPTYLPTQDSKASFLENNDLFRLRYEISQNKKKRIQQQRRILASYGAVSEGQMEKLRLNHVLLTTDERSMFTILLSSKSTGWRPATLSWTEEVLYTKPSSQSPLGAEQKKSMNKCWC